MTLEFDFTLSDTEQCEAERVSTAVIHGLTANWAGAIAMFAGVATSISAGLFLIDEPGVGVVELTTKLGFVGGLVGLVFYNVFTYFSSKVSNRQLQEQRSDLATHIVMTSAGITVQQGACRIETAWRHVLQVSSKEAWIVIEMVPAVYALPDRVFSDAATRKAQFDQITAWLEAGRTPGPWQ
jgi:hypothetical protein